MSDPVVNVEVMKQKKSTQIKKQCVFVSFFARTIVAQELESEIH